MDPIADMLVSIKNALAVKKNDVEVPASKLKLELAKILKQEGFIENFQVTSSFRLQIKLKYRQKSPCITGLERVSRPGCRIYVKNKEIPKVLGGLGIAILSTPQGVMTDKEARQKGIGGELICKVW